MFKTFAAATATVALALGLSLVAVAPANADETPPTDPTITAPITDPTDPATDPAPTTDPTDPATDPAPTDPATDNAPPPQQFSLLSVQDGSEPKIFPNNPDSYETPGTGEVCAKLDLNTSSVSWTQFSLLPANATLTKVVIKAGNVADGGGPEDHGYYIDSTYAFPQATGAWAGLISWTHVSDLNTTYTFTDDNGKGRTLSHAIYCWVPATDVTGSAVPTNPVCGTDSNVVPGFITVTVSNPAVTYKIQKGGVDTGVTSGGALAAGTYVVLFSVPSGFNLTTPASSGDLVIGADPTNCGEVPDEVTPSAVPTGETCNVDLESAQKVPGFITVSNVNVITYTITRDSDSSTYNYDANGKSDPLPSGAYTVHPVAKPGSTLSSAADIHVTVAAFDGVCQQEVTHPLVDPSAVQKQLGCSTDGSYTLTSDQLNPDAVLWTVNSSSVSQGTYAVTGAGTFHVTAAPAPGFGFAGDAQHQLLTWDFTFVVPSTCDLKTLALTGTDDGTPLLAASAMLMLLGVALVRSGLRIRRRDTAAS